MFGWFSRKPPPPQPYPLKSPEWDAVCGALIGKLGYPPSAALNNPNVRKQVEALRPRIERVRVWADTIADRRLAATYHQWLDFWERCCRKAVRDQERHEAGYAVGLMIPKPPKDEEE